MTTVLLLIIAIAPCLAIAFFIYLKNIHNPGPPRLIFLSLSFGVISFFLSLGLGLILRHYTNIQPDDPVQQLIRALIFVGLLEEGCKFFFLRGVIYRSNNFQQPFDGIVYGVMIGMGFATAENLVYFYSGDGGTLIIRMLTAVPAHAAFAVIMGFFVGEAKVFHTSSFLYSAMALLFATFAHGYYDYFLFLSFVPGLWWQSIAALIIVIGITHYAIKRRQEEIAEAD